MSKSAILKSSLAKKYWMALTGLFLCTFLIGHLLGNMQLVMKFGEEGKRSFNEYAYFMAHNIFIKILSYVTYISIIFHAVDGLMLAVQNKKARPQNYAYNNAKANSSTASRNMAILGTIVLVFIVTHMANFWYKAKVTGDIPLHTVTKTISTPIGQNPMTGEMIKQDVEWKYVLTTAGKYEEFAAKDPKSGQYIDFENQKLTKNEVAKYTVKDKTHLYDKSTNLKVAEGYKDLHSVVMAFFGQEGKGMPVNNLALVAVIGYVISMFVLGFHLWHGFASAFQTLGIRHKRYTPAIEITGKLFSVIVPLLFAIIPVLIYIGFVN